VRWTGHDADVAGSRRADRALQLGANPRILAPRHAQPAVQRQPRTYTERVAAARDMVPLVTGRQAILIDDLTPGASNPVWCTYGTCPNCAFLIRQDGTVDTVQTWLDASAMERAVRALLGR